MSRFLRLEKMPFTDDFVAPQNKGSEFLHNLEVYWCRQCHTAQTLHDVEVSEYYEDYQYSVGNSGVASRFMESLAGSLLKKYFPGRSDLRVLEVGSGDGGQLIPFKNRGCDVLGYEPSTVLCSAAAAKGIPSIQGLFTSDSVDLLPDAFKCPDIILLSYTFDHLPDPMVFLQTIREILEPENGLVVIEIHDLEKIFERAEYCLFEHEHSIYLTRATAKDMLRRAGLEIIDFNIVPEEVRRANSLVFVACPDRSRRASLSAEVVGLEQYSNESTYVEGAAKIQFAIANISKFLDLRKQAGRRVAGYGAGGRGVMTLAAVPNAREIVFLVDKKPKHKNILTPKSHIPVIALDSLSHHRTDDFLVFSFGYLSEIRVDLARYGYGPGQLHNLIDILEGRFEN